MFENLTAISVSIPNLIIRGVVVYVFILVLMRISGKREMGHMGVVEFVTVLLISNAVQNSMNAGDNSLTAGLILATTLIALSLIFSFFSYKSHLFSKVFEGTPTLLVHKGKLIKKHLQNERLRESELRVLLRKQGFHHYEEVASAILESDGTLSVTREGDKPFESKQQEADFDTL